MSEQSRPGRETWGTRLGVILAVTGSAVGLGNFLRFPGLAAKYEGGAFLVPYFISFFLLGLPIAWAEWAMGRYGGSKGFNSAPGIMRVIAGRNRVAPYLGSLGLLIPVVVYMYYVYIEAWCLGYAVKFASGTMFEGVEPAARPERVNEFFASFTGANENGVAFTQGGSLIDSAFPYLLLCFALNFVLIYRGLTRGIELFCRYAMPALIGCAIVVLIRVLTLGTPDPAKPDQNVINALGFMWNPSTTTGFFEALANPQMWLEAAGQIFFSLSVGFGIIMCYASYMKRDDDIALSSVTAAAGNEFCEVGLGGMITVPAAFLFLGAAATTYTEGGTFAVGFKALPMVFETMPAGRFVGTLFFFLLFLAAVTSSLSMLQPAIALLEEGLGLGRRASVSLLGFVTAVGTGFVVWFSEGLTALDTMDFWVGTLCIYVLATIQVVMFGWVMGIDRGYEELERGAAIRIPRFVMFIIKYVAPVYLLGIFTLWVLKQGSYVQALRTSFVAQITVGFLVLVWGLFILLIAASVRRWRAIEAGETGAAAPAPTTGGTS